MPKLIMTRREILFFILYVNSIEGIEDDARLKLIKRL